MAIRNRADAVDMLYTATWANMQQKIADNIFDSVPFFHFLKKKGKLEAKTGGRRIEYPLVYAKNEQVGWLPKGGTVSLTDMDVLTTAEYEWKWLIGSMVRFRDDDQQNAGKAKLQDLIKTKVTVTQESLTDKLEEALFAATTTDGPDGLQRLVPDNPAADVEVGTINQLTHTWWRSKTDNMTGLSFATHGEAHMSTMINNTGNNRRSERPDIILSGQVPYEYLEAAQNQYKIIQQEDLLNIGFDHFMYKKIPVFWSPQCADTRMYFLNTNYLALVYDKRYNFSMTKWKDIPNQPEDRAAQILYCATLVTSRRRCLGVMHTIDTA